MDNTIDRKGYNEKEFKELLVHFLKTKPQGTTQLEMVVGTGLSKDWVELAVRALLDDYPAHLETNDKHELIYVFDFDAQEPSLTFGMVVKKMLWGAWQGFMFFFKGWTLLMYCSYFIINAIILLLFFILISILAIFSSVDVPTPAFLDRAIDSGWAVVVDAFESLNRRPGQKKEEPGAIHQMFSYIFGETRAKKDDLAIEKLLLSFIAQNKGKIVTTEIVQLTGWSIRKAQEEAAQLMANYHGDAEVTDEGVIVYYFPELEDNQEVKRLIQDYKENIKHKKLAEIRNEKEALLVAEARENNKSVKTIKKLLPTDAELIATHSDEIDKAVSAGVAPIWIRLVPARRMNDNNEETNKNISSGNKFNWVMSFLSPFMLWFVIAYVLDLFGQQVTFSPVGSTYLIVLFVIPFSYSFLFWLIPRLRWFGVAFANRRIDMINEQHRLLGVIFEYQSGNLYRNAVLAELPKKVVPKGKKLRNKDLGILFNQKVRELEGESHASDQGIYYTFEQVETDLKVIEKIRNG